MATPAPQSTPASHTKTANPQPPKPKPKNEASMLFHSKRKPIPKTRSLPKVEPTKAKAGVYKPSPTPPPGGPPAASSSSSTSATAKPRTTIATAGASNGAAPDVAFQDYKLMSCARHGWRYDVMKFDSRKPVDIATWRKPVKLNRKEPRNEAAGANANAQNVVPVAAGPMLGPDGNPVIGADGRIVMVDAEGKPIHLDSNSGRGAGGKGGLASSGLGNGKVDDKGKRKKFQKKTRQVFLVPDDVRRLRKEERFPWVMEDSTGGEVWVGRMEEAAKSNTHALFMPAADNIFRFVPAHRWYKFQKRRPFRHVLSLEEAEKMMSQKSKDQGRWTMRLREGVAGGGGGEGSSTGGGGGGGRRLRVVDTGPQDLFGDDDDDGGESSRRAARERGQEGDLDEVEYESDFADDEEPGTQEGMDDEMAKELEERIKKEYKAANKTREGYIDESDEEEDAPHLSGSGKAMKKLVRKVDKNGAYDSDEEENPYASSAEEEDEEEPSSQAPGEPAVQPNNISKSRSQTPALKPPVQGQLKVTTIKPGSKSGSRTGSPAPGVSPIVKTEPRTESLGGHSIVAKRATSPRPPAPKLKQSGSRATSPLAGGGSRAGSPVPPISPIASGTPKPPKRKAEDGGASGASGGQTNGAAPKKKRKGSAANPSSAAGASSGGAAPKATVAPGTKLTPALLIRWLRETPNAKTRECIQYFQPCLSDEATKENFTALVKQLVTMKDGMLILKAPYREGDADAIVVPV